MKKLIVLPAAVMILLVPVHAQTDVAAIRTSIASTGNESASVKKERKKEKKELKKLKGSEVSYQAKQQFAGDFGKNTNVQWTREENFDKAVFTQNGATMNAWYDADARLVGTSMEKSFADLPVKVQLQINKRYHDYTKKDVIFFDDNELNETDMILYGQRFDDADNYFVELQKGNKDIVLQVNMRGEVSLFREIKT